MFRKILSNRIGILKFIIGLLIGIVGTLFIWVVMDTSDTSTIKTRQCMTQQIHIFSTYENNLASFIIGEVVICARDWQISNLYGPDVETFYGKIKLRDWDSKEFTTE